MKYLRATNKILDMEIHRDWEMRKLYLSHKNYIEKVLERFGIHGSELVSTLLITHFKHSSALSPQIEEEREYMSHVPYASEFESIMYVMVCTRPDISYAISMVSRYIDCPQKIH